MTPTDEVGDFRTERNWWEQRRLRYNIGLVAAGLLAFVCYVVVVDRGISTGTMPDAEITLFTTAFQAVGYLFMMALANVCYLAGPLSESIVKPTNVDHYRRLTFRLGFWFSVLLPFTIPGLIAWFYLIHPSAATPR
ncbi:MAG: hypothetical protein JWO13_2226 [Acidobacteriales bacterium]|nr:hypothetical protein [Terriglobales bacterium]